MTVSMLFVSLLFWWMPITGVRGWISSIVLPRSSHSTHHTRRSSTVVFDSSTTIVENDVAIPKTVEEEYDVVVIGSGVGGLSCGGLCALYGLRTIVLEAHDTPGGVAHAFERYSSTNKNVPFRFDSGPSLISGLSNYSTNPLRQVLDALGTAEDIDWKTYDGWIVHDTSETRKLSRNGLSSFKITTGDRGEFERAIESFAGVEARQEFERFREQMLRPQGLSQASTYIPPFALRGGVSAVRSLTQYMWKLLRIGFQGTFLTGPFSKVLDHYDVQDPFVRKWFDYLAFALSGLDASHTQAAPIAYMMLDLHKPNAVLDYPMGGMESLIQNGLVRGLEKHGGELRLKSRVEKMILQHNENSAECTGVILADGSVIKARKGVVSNAPVWNMARILQDSLGNATSDGPVAQAVQEIQKQADNMPMTGSFMHLHLGIPKDGLPEDLECHHSVLDLDKDITAEQNMVIISIPTVFDPSLAPEGYHVVHAYTAACDSFDPWEKFLENGVDSGKVGSDPNSGTAAAYSRVDGYAELKDQQAEVLWKAVERVIPDVRERAKRKGSVVLVGTPLTHRRYNQRFRGTYGPANIPGKDVWEVRYKIILNELLDGISNFILTLKLAFGDYHDEVAGCHDKNQRFVDVR
jgi:phytoene dehydrogenase-like protein